MHHAASSTTTSNILTHLTGGIPARCPAAAREAYQTTGPGVQLHPSVPASVVRAPYQRQGDDDTLAYEHLGHRHHRARRSSRARAGRSVAARTNADDLSDAAVAVAAAAPDMGGEGCGEGQGRARVARKKLSRSRGDSTAPGVWRCSSNPYRSQ